MIDRLSRHLPRAWLRVALVVALLASALVGVRAVDLGGVASTGSGSSPSATIGAAAGAAPASASDGSVDLPPQYLNGGGARNVVDLLNRTDDRLVVRGAVSYTGTQAPKVTPVNIAAATASCTGCQTYAVALQITVYQRGAPVVAPQNAASAVNAGCSGCVTVARAVQYTIPVDDIHQIPSDVHQLVHDLNAQLQSIEGVYDTSQLNAFQADDRILGVVRQFQSLAQDMLNESQVETAPDGTAGSPPASEEASPSESATAPGGTEAPTATQVEPTTAPTSGAGTGSAAPTACATPNASDPTATADPAAGACPTTSGTGVDTPSPSSSP